MKSPRFPAHVDDQGRIVPVHPERLRRLVGRDVWVSVHDAPVESLRTDRSNKYLWSGVYGAIAYETGNDPKSIHYGLKRKALAVGILEPQYVLLGDKLIEDEPTTVAEQGVFSRYVDWIRHEAEHGDLTGSPFHIPSSEEWNP